MKARLQAVFEMAAAITKVVANSGAEGVPSGILYSRVCGCMDIHTYNSMIATLRRSDLLAERGHVLYYTGPALVASEVVAV